MQLAQGELPACHATKCDGTEVWSQIGYEVSGGNSFSVRAYTSDAQPSSHDLVLQVLATLTFMPPAQPQAGRLRQPRLRELHQAGRHAVHRDARRDGGQYGICFFDDNRQCEEWALLRGDCPVGGLKVTGYITPAANTARSRAGPTPSPATAARRRARHLHLQERRTVRRLGLLQRQVRSVHCGR